MTFSLIGYDGPTESVGICSITSSPAHGQRCPHFRKGVGIITTQARTNRHHGELGIELLALGLSPEECLRTTAAQDFNLQHRQIGIIDHKGRKAAFTGELVKDAKGQIVGEDHVVVGNYLTSDGVLEATAQGFRAATGELADRLLAGCSAGQAAGGELGGSFSGFLVVIRPDQMQPWGAHVDIRIDYAASVVPALEAALAAYREWEGERLRDPILSLDGVTLPVSSLRSPRRSSSSPFG